MKLSTQTNAEYRRWLQQKVLFYTQQIESMEKLGSNHFDLTEQLDETITLLKTELNAYQTKLKEAYNALSQS